MFDCCTLILNKTKLVIIKSLWLGGYVCGTLGIVRGDGPGFKSQSSYRILKNFIELQAVANVSVTSMNNF